MHEITVFENEQFGQVRTMMVDGEPCFVAVDVCQSLEINNSRMALERLDGDEKMTVSLTDSHSGQRGGAQSITVVNEPGLYTLVLGSRKPEAKAFKRWITHDVIPSIRKTGGYQIPMTREEELAHAFLLASNVIKERDEKILELEGTVETMTPKVNYYDRLVDSNLLTNIRDTSKELNMRQNEFVDWLLKHGYVYRDNSGTLRPYAQYATSKDNTTAGYFVLKERSSGRTNWSGVQTLVTVKGKEHFLKQLSKESNLIVFPTAVNE